MGLPPRYASMNHLSPGPPAGLRWLICLVLNSQTPNSTLRRTRAEKIWPTAIARVDGLLYD
jgi:hypothetical protein